MGSEEPQSKPGSKPEPGPGPMGPSDTDGGTGGATGGGPGGHEGSGGEEQPTADGEPTAVGESDADGGSCADGESRADEASDQTEVPRPAIEAEADGIADPGEETDPGQEAEPAEEAASAEDVPPAEEPNADQDSALELPTEEEALEDEALEDGAEDDGSDEGDPEDDGPEAEASPLPPTDRPSSRFLVGFALTCALALLAGGGLLAFRFATYHPFGDARACDGSDQRLPDRIVAGGAALPNDASDVHYFTHNGATEVSFRSSLTPDYLRRTGVVSDSGEALDPYTGQVIAEEGLLELQPNVCGAHQSGPTLAYRTTTANGTGVTIQVETDPASGEARTPGRTVVAYTFG